MRLAVLVIGATFALTGCQWIPGTDANAAEKGKKAAAALLRDPSSAQFRDVRVVPSDEVKLVCGEINGKNGHGAYAGFTAFVAQADGAAAEIDPQTGVTAESATEAVEQCKRAVDRARRSGFTDLARYECDRAEEALDSAALQAQFDIIYSACFPDEGVTAEDDPSQG